MPKIVWKGIINGEEDFPSADIPCGAVKTDTEEDMRKMQIKALPFAVPSVLICIVCMLAKTLISDERVVDFPFLFLGVVLGIFFLAVHELLHAAAFPHEAEVFIGIMPKSFTAVALSSSPVKRNRFIFISLLPIILGLIPLIAFCFMPGDLKVLNGLLFGFAVMGMTSVYPDLYNAFYILKTVPKNAVVQNDRNITYYYFE